MRLTSDVFVAAAGSWLPEARPVADAVAAGLVGPANSALGYESVAVSEDASGPEMAVRAGRLALARGGIDPAEVGLVMHSFCGYQGHEMWPVAAYVAHETVGTAAVGFEVQQRCAAGLGSLYLAAGQISAGFTSAALLTSGDRFAEPWVDRWNLQDNFIFADGGGALLVSGRRGFARVVAVRAAADNSLERWNRGLESFGTAPGRELPLRLRERGMQHAVTPEAAGSWERYEHALGEITAGVLADAGATTEDIARVVVPHIHRGQSPENYELLGFTEKQSTWDLGRRIGHVGVADQFIGLEHLLLQGELASGDLVLLLAAGEGFSFAAAVLQILEPPAWE
ncbi:ketoacyl-ACP synthase III family protein [Streptomyces sp. J2-1]|uniref:ketoacyl-ACP synthase III family protein n=1 Tax=Streptomyces corallincola TaxID=2851888 RepID=UPI001C38B733|nr:ketoacyl-ACP synthase III family protein [Streptomyces corallincola]MBV2355202.1 ketoacyl-ACP synthase III family protein [Streptomyces corallincola]